MTDPTPPHRRSPMEHERDAALDYLARERSAARIEALEAERDRLQEALIATAAALTAALSLLGDASREAAPSNKMFDVMLDDYRRALAPARPAEEGKLMPRRTPCLNYPSRSAAVRALYAKGLSWNEIAEQTGIDKRAVAGYMPRKRKDDRWKNSLSVRIPAHLLLALTAEAEKRDLTPTGLVRALVIAAVDEALIPAILDDE